MIGLGTMGRNLLLNMAEKGFPVAGYDKNPEQAKLLEREGGNMPLKSFTSLADMVANLQKPRAVMMLVPAGPIVDAVIADLLPLLDKGDLIIDGGNSKFTDTDRRSKELAEQGIHFFGMGISGGEEGARHGPSMMPGGDPAAYKTVQPIFEKVAAHVNGEPCVTYIGPGASGHFVKMVHNGIEYALMQLIAEAYDLMKNDMDMDDASIQAVFKKWNEGPLQSFLLEITADIFAYKKPGAGHLLLDDILDVAKSKGTGKWTSQFAMDLNLPVPAIDTAVSMRDLSKYKALREQFAQEFPKGEKQMSFDVAQLEKAFYFSMIAIYAQGMHLLHRASEVYGYGLDLGSVAKIWRGGCIIRAAFLETIFSAFQKNKNLEHLFSDGAIHSLLTANLPAAKSVVKDAMWADVPVPVFAATLNYFNALRSAKMPTNLIQAQRDYFGAHTYELAGKEGVFHTEWAGK